MLQVIIAGRLTKDADLRTTQSGDAILTFSVAVDVGFGDKKHAVFTDCSIFGKRGETLKQYLTKGCSVTVAGAGDLRSWESNGKSGTSLTCRVAEVTLQGGKRDAGQPDAASKGGSSERDWQAPISIDDEIPF